MTEITINEDKSLSVAWKGKKGRGSLFQIGASGCVTQVNALNFHELMAVHFAVKAAAFPLGKGEQIYRMVLKNVEEKIAEGKVDLGELRKAMLEQASGGCNAPYDSYLQIAYDIKIGKTPVHNY